MPITAHRSEVANRLAQVAARAIALIFSLVAVALLIASPTYAMLSGLIALFALVVIIWSMRGDSTDHRPFRLTRRHRA